MSSLTIQTNIASLIAQHNLSQTNLFQQKTITALTSGYRINASGDDPAGLAVANGYSAQVAELTQGVANANDGLSTLQTADGGLSNISTILNQLQTLATQSASGTFSGSRSTLNNEYQTLLGEITRQASDIGLNAGGANNTVLNVFIGGGNNFQNGQVTIDLSGATNGVDAVSLGLGSTSIVGGGTGFAGNTVNNLSNPNASFNAGTGSQTFNVSYLNANNQIANTTLTVDAAANGLSGTNFINQLNNQLQQAGATGIGAQIGSDGALQFTGGNLLSVTSGYQANAAFTAVTDGTGTGPGATTETLQLTAGGTAYTINLDSTNAADASTAVSTINTAISGSGVTASVGTGGNILFSGSNAFTLSEGGYSQGAAGTSGAAGYGGLLYGFQSDGTTAFGAPGAQAGITSPTVAGASNNTLVNGANYQATGAFTGFAAGVSGSPTNTTQQFQITAGGQNYTVNLTSDTTNASQKADTLAHAVASINTQLAQQGSGVTAVANGSSITLQGPTAFTVTNTGYTQGAGTTKGYGGLFYGYTSPTSSTFGATGAQTVTAPAANASATGNAANAVSAVTAAIQQLGLTQGRVGAGEQDLSYATTLATSQITNISAAESRIRDANMAAEAANLTKAQVLQQASLAALAQANAAPASVLALLKG